jgi:hypothetical protein
MRGKWHYVAAALFFSALIYDFFLWGGLARMPTLSRVMTDATSRELAWGGIYLPVGAKMVDLTGLKSAAAAHASGVFGPIESRLLAQPDVAMETITKDMPFGAKLPYYGAPLLLPVFVLMWWRRPRGVHMIGRRK